MQRLLCLMGAFGVTLLALRMNKDSGMKNKFFVSLAFQNVKRTSLKRNISNFSTQLAFGYIWHLGKVKEVK